MSNSMMTENKRVVVALNNMGITLSMRRCYVDAMMTFKDALDVMGSYRSSNYTEETTTGHYRALLPTEIAFAKFLEQASHRVAQSSSSSSSSLSVKETDKLDPSSSKSFHLTVLSQDDCSQSFSAVIQKKLSRQAGVAILIDYNEDAEVNTSLLSAIILLNMSVVCRMYAQQQKSSNCTTKRRTRLIDRAYQCSEMANNILSFETDVLEDECALRISILVLQELTLLCSIKGDMVIGKKFQRELRGFRILWSSSYEAQLTVHANTIVASAA